MVKIKDTTSFIQRAREVHGDRFDYSVSKCVYLGCRHPVTITCCKHGDFVIDMAGAHCNHKRKGCPICETYGRLLASRLAKIAREGRKESRNCQWTKWADGKIAILSQRVLSSSSQSYRTTDSLGWKEWALKMNKERLRSKENKWQRKCRSWAWGLVRRELQGKSY